MLCLLPLRVCYLMLNQSLSSSHWSCQFQTGVSESDWAGPLDQWLLRLDWCSITLISTASESSLQSVTEWNSGPAQSETGQDQWLLDWCRITLNSTGSSLQSVTMDLARTWTHSQAIWRFWTESPGSAASATTVSIFPALNFLGSVPLPRMCQGTGLLVLKSINAVNNRSSSFQT